MRRYLQGTLDFACGVYAVINGLSITHDIPLADARVIFQDTHMALAANPAVWSRYLKNETDHYWLVRILLRQVCLRQPYKLDMKQPFANWLRLDERVRQNGTGSLRTPVFFLPGKKKNGATGLAFPCVHPEDFALPSSAFYLPEEQEARGPATLTALQREVSSVWAELAAWLQSPLALREKRAAILRFHRFLPGYPQPVVSHWTTAHALQNDTLLLHDASAEQGSIFELEYRALTPQGTERPLLRIVPESLILIKA